MDYFLKIRITQVSTHPHLGGEETESWDFNMCDGPMAEKQYRELRKLHEMNPYVSLEIRVVHVRF